ncbi:hypothetical protein IB232_12870 [Pseudomonas sp. PDM15]|uniref:CARDB domain-containing protein n=1 Tax=Pseudomonas sp. PDM15 TaxID=2769303 RepID=UPI00177CB3E0|nr:CARDB domain-containing protein [Pseudomonas sp. PDM15]MBD9426220.1 hypothetical protein [Pseudomonas sp. PDM15]
MQRNLNPLFLGLLLACSGAASAEDTYAPDNVTPSTMLSGIKRIEVKQTGPVPVIRVQSDGTSYTAVKPGQQVVWQASSQVECRGVRKIDRLIWWINDNSQVGPRSYHIHHQRLLQKDWITSKSKHNSHSTSGSINVPVSAKLANAAKQACNSYLKAEQAKGRDLKQILAEDKRLPATDKPLLAGVVYLQCNGLDDKEAHAWQHVKIETICEGYDFPNVAPKPQGLDLAAAFALEQPKIKVEPTPYSGTCPVTLKVEGTLKANKGQQQVQYRWAHNGGLGPVYTTTLNTSGWRSVAMQLKDIGKQAGPNAKLALPNQTKGQPGLQLKGHAANVHSGQVELKVLAMGESNWSKAKSAAAAYQVTCKEAPKPAPDTFTAPQPKPAQIDLSYAPALTIGNAGGQWGGSLKVDASQTGRQREGRCELRLVYDVKNLGQAAAGAFVSRLREDQELLHNASLPGLAGGAQHKVSGLIYLGNGTHLLGLSVDDQQQVGESNESNNKARVTVEVRNCGQTQPGRAPLRAPVLPQ